MENWEYTPNKMMESYVHYNLACTYSRLSGHETDTAKKKELLDLAVASLKKAAVVAITQEEQMDKDLKLEDLSELGNNPAYAGDVDDIRREFRKGWERRDLWHGTAASRVTRWVSFR